MAVLIFKIWNNLSCYFLEDENKLCNPHTNRSLKHLSKIILWLEDIHQSSLSRNFRFPFKVGSMERIWVTQIISLPIFFFEYSFLLSLIKTEKN